MRHAADARVEGCADRVWHVCESVADHRSGAEDPERLEPDEAWHQQLLSAIANSTGNEVEPDETRLAQHCPGTGRVPADADFDRATHTAPGERRAHERPRQIRNRQADRPAAEEHSDQRTGRDDNTGDECAYGVAPELLQRLKNIAKRRRNHRQQNPDATHGGTGDDDGRIPKRNGDCQGTARCQQAERDSQRQLRGQQIGGALRQARQLRARKSCAARRSSSPGALTQGPPPWPTPRTAADRDGE